MPQRSSLVVACAAAGVVLFSQRAFVPAPKVNRRAQISAVAGSVAALGATPAFADQIGDAAVKLSDASYPFLKEIDWQSYVYNIKPGSAAAVDWVKAIDKAIVMGTAMDSKLLKEAVLAHTNAIKTMDASLLCSKADYTAVNAAIGRIVASVPEQLTMDVYNTFDSVVPKTVPEYMMSKVNADDAKKAYEAFIEFKEVVKANPIAPKALPLPSVAPEKLSIISAAATKLSAASYPFMKDVDWTSDIFTKPFPGADAKAVMKAVDKTLVMGASMDGRLLKDAAEAHHKAIGSIDAKGIPRPEDYEAINAGIGKLIASVPKSQVLDVFNAWKDLAGPVVPTTLYSAVGNPGDAITAYNAFWKFKDVVATQQR